MRILYFDVTGGASGDMILGALLDAGAREAAVREALDGLGVGGWQLVLEEVNRAGLRALFANVIIKETHSELRRLPDIRRILEKSPLDDAVRSRALRTFERLADAEAAVHGVSRDQVHVHEIGAVDTIIDIVGATAALADLSVERVYATEVGTGKGFIEVAHGRLPVPAPATLKLLEGVPVLSRAGDGELTTPTGAAILREVVDEFAGAPSMRIVRTGVGGGSRNDKGRPNVLRAIVGESAADTTSDVIEVLECNLDDMTGEEVGALVGPLLDDGALDVYLVSVQMKKGRPGQVLTVLCRPESRATLEERIFRESSTLGIRRRTALRTTLPRRVVEVDTPYGRIRVKAARIPGGAEKASAEFEDCARAAEAHRVSVRDVMASALEAFRRLP